MLEKFHSLNEIIAGEDLAVRTLARAVKAEGDFATEAAYFSFLCTILVNLRRDDLRLKAANALVFTDDLPDVEDARPDPREALAAKSDAEAVRLAVSRLSPVIRETVVMRYFGDMSVSEMATRASSRRRSTSDATNTGTTSSTRRSSIRRTAS